MFSLVCLGSLGNGGIRRREIVVGLGELDGVDEVDKEVYRWVEC